MVLISYVLRSPATLYIRMTSLHPCRLPLSLSPRIASITQCLREVLNRATKAAETQRKRNHTSIRMGFLGFLGLLFCVSGGKGSKKSKSRSVAEPTHWDEEPRHQPAPRSARFFDDHHHLTMVGNDSAEGMKYYRDSSGTLLRGSDRHTAVPV